MTTSFLRMVLRPKVLLIIATHWAVAITLVFVNKQLVSVQYGGKDLAVFIAWSQCVFSLITISVATATKRCLGLQTSWLSIPLTTFIHRDVLAMTFTFIGVIIMNNLLLKHIGVAFYQVARSSTLIFTVIFSRVFLGVHVTLPVIISCVLIIIGFVVSVDQEMVISSLSLVSISYGVLASMSAALGGIFTKRAVRLVHGDSLGITLTNNANTVVFLFPLMLSTGQLQFVLSSDHFLNFSVCWKLMATGVLSLFMGWASTKVISLTSPLTHNMSINAKSLLQTFIAVMVEGQTKTLTWWVGNFLVILGILTYGFSQEPPSDIQEMEEIIDFSDGSPSKVVVDSKKGALF